MELCAWHVGQVGASAVGDEVPVIGAPGDQRRRLLLAQVALPRRVQRDVARVVVEQVEHHLIASWEVEEVLVERPEVRVEALGVGDALDVLSARRLKPEEGARCRFGGLAILPVGRQAAEVRTDPRLVRVAVLDDQRVDALWVTRRQAESDWRAEVEHVQPVVIQVEGVDEAVDDVGEPVECRRALERLGVAEAGVVGRDEVEAIREAVDQLLVLGRGSREPVQQEQRRRSRIAGLAVEHLDAIDVDCAICSHRSSFEVETSAVLTAERWSPWKASRTFRRRFQLAGRWCFARASSASAAASAVQPSRPSSVAWISWMAGPGGIPSWSRSTVRARSYTASASATLPRAARACMSSP